MARDYNHRRQTSSRRSAPSQLLTVVIAFLLGYVTASVMDVEAIHHWMQTEVLAGPKAPAQQPAKAAAVPQPKKQAELPKPKFEFYTLLTKEQRGDKQVLRSAKSSAANSVQNIALKVQPASKSQDTAVAVQKVETTPPAKAVAAALPAAKRGEAYVIQAAAFKTRQDAEKVKARLILRGYDVSVVGVAQAQAIWYRVMLGPYNNRQLAEQNLNNLIKGEHIRGILKRMQA